MYEVAVYASMGRKMTGDTCARGTFENKREAKREAVKQADNGYWVEIFAEDGELLEELYPE